MKNSYKRITIAIILLILGTSMGYVYSEGRTKAVAVGVNYENPVSGEEALTKNNDISNNIEPTDSFESKSPFSSSTEIVIYNSHAHEDYPSGMKVTDVSGLINKNLAKEGLNSRVLKCDAPSDYAKAYDVTRDLIIKNVKDYSTKVLLDIHRDMTKNDTVHTKEIKFILTTENPHYKENKEFADLLLTEFEKYNEIKSNVIKYKKGVSYFNQDLSGKSLVIEIGNNMSSDSDIDTCVNTLVSALNSILKTN